MFTESDREAYIQSLKEHKYDHEKITFRDAVPIVRLLSSARARLWEAQKRRNKFPKCNLYFHVDNLNRTFKIDFATPDVQEVDAKSELIQPYIKKTLSSTLLSLCLINHISWNMADGALFFEYERVPNQYDPEVYALINYLTV
jgi:UDP-MurNAc hydroxylase